MIAGEDGDQGPCDLRAGTSAPGREPFDDFLHAAKRTGRLRQRCVTLAHHPNGSLVGSGQHIYERAEIVKRQASGHDIPCGQLFMANWMSPSYKRWMRKRKGQRASQSVAAPLKRLFMELLKETMRSLAFVSRLPVSPRWFSDYDGSLAGNVRGFPFAGIIIALPAALVLLVAASLPSLVSALIVVAVLIITTGALHEDGLADVADGFYGGASTERRLEIMKDSAIGSYGTLALILSVLLRTVLLASVF